MEGDLLGLGEVVGGVGVQGQLADQLHGRELLGHQLGRVEQVDPLERLGAVVGHHLQPELVLEERTRVDPVGQVATMEVRVAPGGDLRLFPDEGVDAGHGLPVELHQAGPALCVDQPEGVDAEALHRAVGARDPAVAHVPHHVVGGLGVQGDEVPEGVVRRLRLGDLAVRVRLGGVDDVRELDAVLDEEDRHVVADQVERALVGVELHREAPGVPGCVGRPTRAQHGREAGENLCLAAFSVQKGSLGHRAGVAVGLEHAVSSGSPSMYDALGDPLVVEVSDLLAQVEVLEQARTSIADLERVVGRRHPQALSRRQQLAGLRQGRRRTALHRVGDGRSASGLLRN